MTILMQTRVDEQIARRFRQAAEERNMSAYELLGELIKKTVNETRPGGWDTHWQWLDQQKSPARKVNAVVATRADETR